MGSARRRLIYLGCAAGLALAVLAYRAQWHYSEFPADFAIDTLAYPVQIETYPAASPEHLCFIAEGWPPGATITILDARGVGHETPLVLRQGRPALVLTGLSGLVFLAVAAFFFAPRSDRPGVTGLFWISFLYGLSIMVGGVFFPRDGPGLLIVFDLVQIACLAALPAIFLNLALTFPRRAQILDRRRWIVPLLIVTALAVFAWQAVVLLRYFWSPTLANGIGLAPAFPVADGYMAALTLVGVTVFAVRSRQLVSTREQNQIRWLLWGFAIGAAPYVFLRSVPELLGLPPLMPEYVDRVVELAIPLSFTMAVVRHQFLDIDVIIRRSLLYVLLAAALVTVYLAAGVVFGRWLGTPDGLAPWLPPLVLGLGAGVAFMPLCRVLGHWIDRTFFKLTYDGERVLDRLEHELAGLAAPAPVADALCREISRVLRSRSTAVVIDHPGGLVTSGDLSIDAARGFLGRHERKTVVAVPLAAALRSTSLPDVESADYPPALEAAGFVLAQTIVTRDEGGEPRVVGLLLVGPRTNDRRFVRRDLVFLAGCARLAARHLERIELQQAVAEEALARQHFADLNQLKSEFLSHVAHDLRTPVTGITWSARNLGDGLVGPLTSDQTEYVETIAQSGEHLNRLVSNLLEVSRLERIDQPLALTAVAPRDVWQRAVTTLEPLAKAKTVTLTLAGSDAPVRVQANADKLMEVAVNLLDNAVKYTAPGSAVAVVIHEPEAAMQAVSVRDHGPGLGDQLPEELFDRFAQGTPSPSSPRKGFGLGLHIVATYLELMGGDLIAANHPDGGAVFTCRLPLPGDQAQPPNEGDPA